MEVVAADELAVAVEVHANLAASAASLTARRLRKERERVPAWLSPRVSTAAAGTHRGLEMEAEGEDALMMTRALSPG